MNYRCKRRVYLDIQTEMAGFEQLFSLQARCGDEDERAHEGALMLCVVAANITTVSPDQK